MSHQNHSLLDKLSISLCHLSMVFLVKMIFQFCKYFLGLGLLSTVFNQVAGQFQSSHTVSKWATSIVEDLMLLLSWTDVYSLDLKCLAISSGLLSLVSENRDTTFFHTLYTPVLLYPGPSGSSIGERETLVRRGIFGRLLTNSFLNALPNFFAVLQWQMLVTNKEIFHAYYLAP